MVNDRFGATTPVRDFCLDGCSGQAIATGRESISRFSVADFHRASPTASSVGARLMFAILRPQPPPVVNQLPRAYRECCHTPQRVAPSGWSSDMMTFLLLTARRAARRTRASALNVLRMFGEHGVRSPIVLALQHEDPRIGQLSCSRGYRTPGTRERVGSSLSRTTRNSTKAAPSWVLCPCYSRSPESFRPSVLPPHPQNGRHKPHKELPQPRRRRPSSGGAPTC